MHFTLSYTEFAIKLRYVRQSETQLKCDSGQNPVKWVHICDKTHKSNQIYNINPIIATNNSINVLILEIICFHFIKCQTNREM